MRIRGLRPTAFAALALAFASLGDAFLYPFLPVNHLASGIPVVWVGILLSVNRFVRILSNSLMVRVFTKHGLRTVMIGAVLLALLSTLGYAVASGIVLWMVFRICWGLSFSAMRIGTLVYALKYSRQGIALGISKGLQEAGPMVALFLTPLLIHRFSAATNFMALSLLSLPALYFAIRLPRVSDETPPVRSQRFFKLPSAFNSITFVSAFLIDGIVVVVLGILFLRNEPSITSLEATTLAALYLGYRRFCLVLLSPAGGWMADRVGIESIFTASLVLVIAGLVVLMWGQIAIGSVIIFTFYSILTAVTPGSAVKGQQHSLVAVAENATWRDVGAAVGTLAGGLLIASPYLTHTLLFTIFSLLILLLVHLGTFQKALKLLYVWR